MFTYSAEEVIMGFLVVFILLLVFTSIQSLVKEKWGGFKKAFSSMSLFAVIGMAVIGISTSAFYSIFDLSATQQKFTGNLLTTKQEIIRFWNHACHMKGVCEIYANVRLECAVAGNVKTCIDIKMRDEDYFECSNEGTINSISKDLIPNVAQCFAWSFLTK